MLKKHKSVWIVIKMEGNSELEEIKRKKLQELMSKNKEDKAQSHLDRPIEVTDDDFQNMINKYPMVVVDFWAPWCGPCKMVGPAIEQLAKEYKGKVVFAKLNVDNNHMTSSQFSVSSIPTMMIFKNGKVVERIIGALPKPQIEQKIKQHL
ncbi:MAG: thioredoxin [Thermoplasmata archaeon]